MSKPQRSPTGLPGNPRNHALDIGTSKTGFPDDLPYDNAAGAPTGSPGIGTHTSNVPRDGSPFTNAPTGPASDPSPIK